MFKKLDGNNNHRDGCRERQRKRENASKDISSLTSIFFIPTRIGNDFSKYQKYSRNRLPYTEFVSQLFVFFPSFFLLAIKTRRNTQKRSLCPMNGTLSYVVWYHIERCISNETSQRLIETIVLHENSKGPGIVFDCTRAFSD